MARVPFIGRLFWCVSYFAAQTDLRDTHGLLTVRHRREYLALFGSLILVALEGFIRIITLGLRILSTPPHKACLTRNSATCNTLLLQRLQRSV